VLPSRTGALFCNVWEDAAIRYRKVFTVSEAFYHQVRRTGGLPVTCLRDNPTQAVAGADVPIRKETLALGGVLLLFASAVGHHLRRTRKKLESYLTGGE
jgi:hypothetical protein